MTYGSQPSLTLLELWERESKAGRQYFSGYWGNLSVALLRDGERPHPTRPDETVVVWRLVASERQPRDAAPKAAAKPPERDVAPAAPHTQRPRPLARVLRPRSGRSGGTARRRGGTGRSRTRSRATAARCWTTRSQCDRTVTPLNLEINPAQLCME
jgi:hypothetical protein